MVAFSWDSAFQFSPQTPFNISSFDFFLLIRTFLIKNFNGKKLQIFSYLTTTSYLRDLNRKIHTIRCTRRAPVKEVRMAATMVGWTQKNRRSQNSMVPSWLPVPPWHFWGHPTDIPHGSFLPRLLSRREKCWVETVWTSLLNKGAGVRRISLTDDTFLAGKPLEKSFPPWSFN